MEFSINTQEETSSVEETQEENGENSDKSNEIL